MVNYRRNLLAGGSYFFTVNLAERRLRLLTDHIDLLRVAFRYVRARHPFTVDAIVVLPDHLHAPTMPCGYGSSRLIFHAICLLASADRLAA